MMASKKIRVADYLIQRIADEGVQDIFLLPGGGAMHLNDAIACEKELRLFLAITSKPVESLLRHTEEHTL